MAQQIRQGIIIKGIGGFYYVKTADGVLECKAKGIFRKQGVTPLAGDRVTVEGSVQDEDLVIADIAPRKNCFARPPVANVDQLFLVVSAIEPRPNIQVVDKMTAISCHNGVMPVIVLTKTDVADADEFERIYTAAGFDVIDVRKNMRRGLKSIHKKARDGLSVFVGNSGVGKSTLLNELCPELTLETAETSKKLGRGKHTTRAVTLYDFAGGYLADTPGFSSVEFERGFRIPKEELAGSFPDFAPYLDGCYFSDCTHRVERGCSLLQAVADGKVRPSRHDSYCALYDEAAQHKEWQDRS